MKYTSQVCELCTYSNCGVRSCEHRFYETSLLMSRMGGEEISPGVYGLITQFPTADIHKPTLQRFDNAEPPQHEFYRYIYRETYWL